MNWSIIIKAVTAVIVVPLAIFAYTMWPKWTKASVPVRIATGLFVLPLIALAAVTTPWWNAK